MKHHEFMDEQWALIERLVPSSNACTGRMQNPKKLKKLPEVPLPQAPLDADA